MTFYGKLASHAIAAMSYLASLGEGHKASAQEMADSRKMSKMLMAKVLTKLASAGLVVGQPGPKGGYALGRPADQIFLMDIVCVFEGREDTVYCPFGKNWCGSSTPCPLHHDLVRLQSAIDSFLNETTLAVFADGRS